MPFGIGPTELIVVLIVALLVVGPKRLPGMAKSVGHGVRELRDSMAERPDTDALPSSEPAPALDRRPTVAPTVDRSPADVSGV